jgi:hypothetical protein
MKIDGLRVVDAVRPLDVEIKEMDCRKGQVKDPGACAAARAIIRKLHVSQARVHLGRTYVKRGQHWIRYMTPASLGREITAFDRGADFEPGTYRFSAPPKTARLGYRMEGGEKSKKGGRRAVMHLTTNVRAHGANR